jgi:hypothetical protein
MNTLTRKSESKVNHRPMPYLLNGCLNPGKELGV